jgi:hypothetical protein
MQAVDLTEAGTHAVCDAGFWPCPTHESRGALRLLRSVCEGLLVLWDRGLDSFEMAFQTGRHRAHLLCRIPAQLQPKVTQRLADGTTLA